jgi:prepilin-type N-terminal cleavage/methylation domain-containing protein
MDIFQPFHVGGTRLRNKRAFTLPELIIATSIFSLVCAGVLVGHLFGMRLLEVTLPKLGTDQESRRAIGLLMADIRSAKILRIGNGGLGSFTSLAINTTQLGNAIQIYPSTDTNVFIRYFLDAVDKKLKRTLDGALASAVAHSISNSLVFTAEDFAGNVLTNFQSNCLVGVNLQFYELKNPKVPIGPGQYYVSYQLRTRLMRRAPD